MSTPASTVAPRSRVRALLTVVLPAAGMAVLSARAEAQDTIAMRRPVAPPAAGVSMHSPADAPRETAASTRAVGADSAALAAGKGSTRPPDAPTAVPATPPSTGAAGGTAPAGGASAALLVAPPASKPVATTVDTAGMRVAPAKSAVAAPPATTAAGQPVAAAPGTTPGIAPGDLANAFVQRAVSFYEQGKPDLAIAEYRKGLADDPLDSDTWYGLAELLRELGRTKQAIETYTLALATIEHAPELRVPFADLLMANRRKPDAIKVLQRGIELDPDAGAEMKAMLGNVVLGVLDDSVAENATTARAGGTTTARAARGAKRARVDRRKRKKLCKLFCAGAFDPVAPKP